jgi:hypothetical protein
VSCFTDPQPLLRLSSYGSKPREAAVRCYHFNAYGPSRQLLDQDGEYLDDMIVVRDLAFAAVREIVSNSLECSDSRRWRIEVVEEDWRTVLVVPFRSVRMIPTKCAAVRFSPSRRSR